jgi:CRP-like cAMP-binding protein
MPRLPILRSRAGGSEGVLDRPPLLTMLELGVAPSKPLYRQTEAADALYLVESGRFREYVSDRPGHERLLQFLGPGEIIGEAAFIADRS